MKLPWPVERRDPPPAHRSWWTALADLLGRLATGLAIVFILFGFVSEQRRNDRTEQVAHKAETIARRQDADVERIARLAHQNRVVLATTQHGRRTVIRLICRIDTRQNRAIRAVLQRFKVATPPSAFSDIDCGQLVAEGEAGGG